MATLNKLTGEPLNDLTLFAVDILANLLALQETDGEPTTHDTYGLGLEQPLANYDPITQSWKTSEDTSLWGEPQLLATLPISGMTRSGVLFLQVDWVPLIDANGLSLWPTPTTQEVEHPNLTLTATGRRQSLNGKTSWSLGLADAVQVRPSQNINNIPIGGKLNPTWTEWLMGFPLGWTDLED